ncbi:MAG: asparaginyl-tRNA synthetase [Alectoria sarmentosa]|nr:MAG: asparaginyl-tRNA synthetase [Alectoria sarmentosa]
MFARRLYPPTRTPLGTGTSVAITGTWQAAPPQKEQPYELKAKAVKIIGAVDAEIDALTNSFVQKYPIQKKYHSAEYLRNIPHLRLRTPINALLARLRSECDYHLASYFRNRYFVRVQPPIITSSDCEGAGEVFTVSSKPPSSRAKIEIGAAERVEDELFKDPKFLTVSSQLHLEAFIHEHQKVWTLSPTFRAEKSDTPRHVAEFWMLEAEIRTESLEDVMNLVEDMIRDLASKLQEAGFAEEILYASRGAKSDDAEVAQSPEILRRRWQGLMHTPWPRTTYGNAIKRLQDAVESGEAKFLYKPSWITGLQLEHEKFIATSMGGGSPVFVTDYPREMKPFYMLPSTLEDGVETTKNQTVACFDLLLPELCEVVGGSMREHRLQQLSQSMHNHVLNVSAADAIGQTTTNPGVSPSSDKGNLEWYADLRRYGSVPHGGFGLGFDRLLAYLSGTSNIKDVVPWPRYRGRCDC